MINLERPETRFAIDIVRQASQLVKRVQAEMVTKAFTKGDFSPVTVADFASQALVGRALAEKFPNQAFVAEESALELRRPDSSHILDQVTGFVSETCATIYTREGLRLDRSRHQRSNRRVLDSRSD